MRSGGHEAELAPARGCEGSRFGACSGRLTWRQKTGGSLPVDAADGSDFEAFALRRRVRRRRKGALLPDDAAKDRRTRSLLLVRRPAADGSGLASVRGCERVEKGSSLPVEGPASGRIGVRFDARLAKRVRLGLQGSPSISTRSCRKADRACPNRRTAKAIVPGELRLSERPPGGEGSGVRVRFEPTEGEDGWLRPPSEPGDGTDEGFGARSHQTLRSGAQA